MYVIVAYYVLHVRLSDANKRQLTYLLVYFVQNAIYEYISQKNSSNTRQKIITKDKELPLGLSLAQQSFVYHCFIYCKLISVSTGVITR